MAHIPAGGFGMKKNVVLTFAALFAAGVAAAGVLAPAAHGAGTGHDHSPTFSAGGPGDPKKPARTVQITMRESDGKMLFIPDRLEIRKGEQVRFVLRNSGALEHEFVLATTAENLKHAEAMKNNPAMEHEEPNGREVEPGKTGELVWRFSKAGEFEFACLIPGHREAGMVGKIVVK
jgi:uncharacterized cupredoxin-like copper-binding protein